jgi:hypothetical protein
MNSKNRNIRDLHRRINEFKRHYQPRSNIVKDENGELLTDSNITVNRWKSYFSQLVNVHDVSDTNTYCTSSFFFLLLAQNKQTNKLCGF